MSTGQRAARAQANRSNSEVEVERAALETLVPDHPETWDAVIGSRCNLLLEGHPRATRAVVTVLTRCLPPVGAAVPWQRARDLPTDDAAALVLHDVAALSPDQQMRLLRRMDRPKCPQIVATSTRAVFPLVSKGLFVEALYYRLNTILVRVNSTVTAQNHGPKVTTLTNGAQPSARWPGWRIES